jgi:hypothetical protein
VIALCPDASYILAGTDSFPGWYPTPVDRIPDEGERPVILVKGICSTSSCSGVLVKNSKKIRKKNQDTIVTRASNYHPDKRFNSVKAVGSQLPPLVQEVLGAKTVGRERGGG